MKNYKELVFSIIFLTMCSVAAEAQMMPIGLNLQAETNNSAPQHYTLETTDKERIASGDLKENIRAKFNVGYMMPVSKKLMLGISGHYDYNNEHLTGISDDDLPIDDNHHSFKAGTNVMYRSTLWNKPLVVFANIGMDFSQWGMERVSGVSAALLMLKATPETQLGIGPLVMLNTTSRLPFLFVATYRHVYSPRWTLNINYPFFGMQYTPSKKHTIAGGFAFDTDYYWVQPDKEDLPKTTFFRRSLLRTGINYDVHLSPTLTFTAQTGWEYTMAGGLYTDNGRHLIHDLNHPSGPYAHLRLSFRPETKLTKKIKAMMMQQRL